MSIVIEQTKQKIKQLEDSLALSESSGWRHDDILKSLASYKKKLVVLEAGGLDKATADMRIILSHTNAVDEKYNCRSVKMMFAFADFLDKPRCISKSLANWLRSYTINKINAPVCSIVASPKPALEPMPGYMDPVASKIEAYQKAQREELLKFRSITNRLYEKPTFKERVKIKLRRVADKVLA